MPPSRTSSCPGSAGRGRVFVLLTDSLLFATQEGININRGSTPRGNASEIRTINADPALLAYDLNDGALLAKISLPSNAAGAPMTYAVDGVQYIVVPVGGASQRAELVALSLDDSALPSHTSEEPAPFEEVHLQQSFPNPVTDRATLPLHPAAPYRRNLETCTTWRGSVSKRSSVAFVKPGNTPPPSTWKAWQPARTSIASRHPP